jgi:hypothetical protein
MGPIQRSDLVEAQRRDPQSARHPDAVRAGITGSGDSLLVLTWTAAALARERAAGVRLLTAAGVRPGMRVANTLPGALSTPGSLLLGDVGDELGALDIPLGTIDSDAAAKQAWELIDRVEPHVLVLDRRGAERFLALAPSRERPSWVGIVWLCTDASPAAPPVLPPACAFHGWQRRWLAVAEVTCFAAITCANQLFHPDEGVRAEVVDTQSGATLPTSVIGTLALTRLGDDATTQRYATALRVRALARTCECGKPGMTWEIV